MLLWWWLSVKISLIYILTEYNSASMCDKQEGWCAGTFDFEIILQDTFTLDRQHTLNKPILVIDPSSQVWRNSTCSKGLIVWGSFQGRRLPRSWPTSDCLPGWPAWGRPRRNNFQRETFSWCLINNAMVVRIYSTTRALLVFYHLISWIPDLLCSKHGKLRDAVPYQIVCFLAVQTRVWQLNRWHCHSLTHWLSEPPFDFDI